MQDSTDPTGVKRTGSGKNVARARERKAKAALQLKMAGADWDEIAEVIGYPSPRQALVAVERALEAEIANDPEAQKRMRVLAGQRLDRLLRGVWAKAINPDNPEHLQAVTKARELIGQHTKLFGYEAPAEFIVHSPTMEELERWVSTVVQAKAPSVEEYDIFEGEIVEDPPALEAGG
jgi:hypothetical protein